MATEDLGHHVVAVPVRKMQGIVAWRFACSCGREGNGWHSTPEKAKAAGRDHFNRKEGDRG